MEVGTFFDFWTLRQSFPWVPLMINATGFPGVQEWRGFRSRSRKEGKAKMGNRPLDRFIEMFLRKMALLLCLRIWTHLGIFSGYIQSSCSGYVWNEWFDVIARLRMLRTWNWFLGLFCSVSAEKYAGRQMLGWRKFVEGKVNWTLVIYMKRKHERNVYELEWFRYPARTLHMENLQRSLWWCS